MMIMMLLLVVVVVVAIGLVLVPPAGRCFGCPGMRIPRLLLSIIFLACACCYFCMCTMSLALFAGTRYVLSQPQPHNCHRDRFWRNGQLRKRCLDHNKCRVGLTMVCLCSWRVEFPDQVNDGPQPGGLGESRNTGSATLYASFFAALSVVKHRNRDW